MQGSDSGKSILVSDPNSVPAKAFTKASKLVAGRVSIIASEIKDQEKAESSNKETSPERNSGDTSGKMESQNAAQRSAH